jgi:hypothetical protein
MTDDLEDASQWRGKIEARVRGLLQSLHLTQQDHTKLLREHGAHLIELRTGQQRIMAGVDAIREMLDRTLSGGND